MHADLQWLLAEKSSCPYTFFRLPPFKTPHVEDHASFGSGKYQISTRIY